MQMSQLVPASTLAQRFGVKCLVYGDPGTGKTPIIKTAPRPVLCVIEPGMLSMRDATNIPAWEAYTPERIDEFFKWLKGSNEAKNFDTVGIDSASQMAERFLESELVKEKHGLKAYGNMAKRVLDIANDLYYMPNKHVYLIAKQSVADENGVSTKRPYFPGQQISINIPHMYDEVLHLAQAQVPGQQKPIVAFRCQPSFNIPAPRDRSGNLSEFEEPHLGKLFAKCMA